MPHNEHAVVYIVMNETAKFYLTRVVSCSFLC